MNLIQSINVISLVLLYSVSMISAGAYNRQAEWVSIGGKKYDFNPGQLTQPEARTRCIREGGKLFEPKDASTNKDVFIAAGAEIGSSNSLWIGVSDVGDEGSFTYVSDATLVNFKCEGSNNGLVGCFASGEPAKVLPNSVRPTIDVSDQLDCVVGDPANNGKWSTIGCTVSPFIDAITATSPKVCREDREAADGLCKGDNGANANTDPDCIVCTTPSVSEKRGSICEMDAIPPTTTTSSPGPSGPISDSTCLKSGITVMIGMLFFCYQ